MQNPSYVPQNNCIVTAGHGVPCANQQKPRHLLRNCWFPSKRFLTPYLQWLGTEPDAQSLCVVPLSIGFLAKEQEEIDKMLAKPVGTENEEPWIVKSQILGFYAGMDLCVWLRLRQWRKWQQKMPIRRLVGMWVTLAWNVLRDLKDLRFPQKRKCYVWMSHPMKWNLPW